MVPTVETPGSRTPTVGPGLWALCGPGIPSSESNQVALITVGSTHQSSVRPPTPRGRVLLSRDSNQTGERGGFDGAKARAPESFKQLTRHEPVIGVEIYMSYRYRQLLVIF